MLLALLMLPGSAPALSKTFDSIEYKDFILVLDREYQVNHTFTRKKGWKIIEGNATWTVKCEVYKYGTDPRYLIVHVKLYKAEWTEQSARETYCFMKIYWTGPNKDNYHIFDGQYYPYSGKYCNNEFVTLKFGLLTVDFSSPAHYLIKVDHYYGWITWTHELTFWGNFYRKSIFTSEGYLAWTVIFISENKSATLNVYFEIGVGVSYNSIFTWNWTNIGTYNPREE